MGVDNEGKNANLVWECVSGNVWKICMFLQHPLLPSVFFAAFSAFLLPRVLAPLHSGFQSAAGGKGRPAGCCMAFGEQGAGSDGQGGTWLTKAYIV